MKKRRPPSLWMTFIISTFMALLVTIIVMTSVAFLSYHFGFLHMRQENPLGPVLILLILSSVVGTNLFLLVGRTFVQPIKRFSKASKAVAKGDFNIKLDEQSRILEVQEMAENFNVMVQELSGIETLRTDFVTNVSHEFKTPLSAIEGYATLLQEKELSDTDRDEYVQMIITSARQLSTLTGNILSLSKLENQEVLPDKSEFRLDEQIRETILLLENKWSDKDIDLVVELEKTKYLGNKNLLRQVWQNLIDNAVKFTAKNGKIEISLINRNGKIIVTVEDNGRGIESSEIGHIFDKFYQSDKARKEAGNGLGLALVKRIVDLCGGTVEIQSQPGKGSAFTVILPDNAQKL